MSLLDNIRGIHTPEELAQRRNAAFREPLYDALPDAVSRYMQVRAASIERTSARDANIYVHDVARELITAKAARAFDEQAIRDYADNYSRHALGFASLASRSDFARRCGIPCTFARSTSPQGRMHRLADPVWWRRQLRKAWTRRAENGLREAGMVRRMVAPYLSDVAVDHYGKRLRRQRDWIESGEVINTDTGEILPLKNAVDASTANPAIRRGELMVRARGFEEIAAFHKHVALFATLTVPSRFHAELMYGGRNPLHKKETVREAQAWLCRQWAKARAKFKRLSILIYGIRVAEPHHDSTPHWHLLLFMRAADQPTVETVLRGMWLSEDAHESGAAQHRCQFESIDASKGSAAGYLAKYVSKNIDGAGQIGSATDDETGTRVAEGVGRVAAWASLYGIRQFQQLGGPAVGIYRELRRVREPHDDRDIERARLAADAGDWAGFTLAVGGILCGRRTHLRPAREGERRRIFAPAEPVRENYYGEPCQPRVIGVKCGSAIAISRPHRWRIQRCTSGPGAAAGTDCAARSDSISGAAGASTADTASRRSLDRVFSNLGGYTKGAVSVVKARRLRQLLRKPARIGLLPRPYLGLFSDLGPVAITVRGAGEPAAWANPNETSRAGPLQ